MLYDRDNNVLKRTAFVLCIALLKGANVVV